MGDKYPNGFHNEGGNQNVNFGNQVNNFNNVTIQGSAKQQRNDLYNVPPDDLYTKRPFISIFWQRLIEIIALLADIWGLYDVINSAWQNSCGDSTFIKIWNVPKIIVTEDMFCFFALFFAFPVICLLISITRELSSKHMYKRLVVLENNVYIIKPRRCPECDGKLKYANKDGEWAFRCSRVPNIHNWPVDPTKLK